MAALGIDFGATQIRGAMISESGEIKEEKAEETRAEEGPDKVIERMRQFIQQFIDMDPDIKAVGVGTPGPVDYLAGTVVNSPNLPGWQVIPLRERLSEGLDIPLVLDRDANMALLGEQWKGELQGVKNGVLLTWGTGVGGALLIDNKIYRGRSSVAGELGHMIIDIDGDECRIGHRGCLESFIGGAAVEKKYDKSLKDIAEGTRQGNESDAKIAGEIGYNLKIGLDNIISLLDPEIIVMDGSVTQSIDVFLPEIKDYPVRASKLATKAGMLGAAKLAIDHLNTFI